MGFYEVFFCYFCCLDNRQSNPTRWENSGLYLKCWPKPFVLWVLIFLLEGGLDTITMTQLHSTNDIKVKLLMQAPPTDPRTMPAIRMKAQIIIKKVYKMTLRLSFPLVTYVK